MPGAISYAAYLVSFFVALFASALLAPVLSLSPDSFFAASAGWPAVTSFHTTVPSASNLCSYVLPDVGPSLKVQRNVRPWTEVSVSEVSVAVTIASSARYLLQIETRGRWSRRGQKEL